MSTHDTVSWNKKLKIRCFVCIPLLPPSPSPHLTLFFFIVFRLLPSFLRIAQWTYLASKIFFLSDLEDSWKHSIDMRKITRVDRGMENSIDRMWIWKQGKARTPYRQKPTAKHIVTSKQIKSDQNQKTFVKYYELVHKNRHLGQPAVDRELASQHSTAQRVIVGERKHRTVQYSAENTALHYTAFLRKIEQNTADKANLFESIVHSLCIISIG